MNAIPVTTAVVAPLVLTVFCAAAPLEAAVPLGSFSVPNLEVPSFVVLTQVENHGPTMFEFTASIRTASSQARLSTALRAKFVELAALPDGWDTRGHAVAPVPASLSSCRSACERLAERASFQEPFVAPNYDGFVQMEWSRPARTLEVEAREGVWNVAGAVGMARGEQEFFEEELVMDDGRALAPYYDWFADESLAWPA